MGEFKFAHNVSCMCVSSDDQLYLGSWSSLVVRVNLREPQAWQFFRGHFGKVFGLALSPDEKILASVSQDCRLILWSVPSGNKLKVIILSMGWVMFVAFSGCGQFLYTGGLDNTMTQHSVATGLVVRTMQIHHGYLSHAVSSTDGRIFCSSGDGSFSMWDVPTGAISRLYCDESRGGDILGLVLSPDNTRMYSAGIEIVVCEWNVGPHITAQDLCTPLRVFAGPTNDLSKVCLSPDGSTLIVGCDDGVVYQWRVGEPQEKRPYDVKESEYMMPFPLSMENARDRSSRYYRPYNRARKKVDRVRTVTKGVRYCRPPEVFKEVTAVVCTDRVVVASYLDGVVRVWRDDMGPGNTECYNRQHLFSALLIPLQMPRPRTPLPAKKYSKSNFLNIISPSSAANRTKRSPSTSSLRSRLSVSWSPRGSCNLPLLPDVIAEIIWMYLEKPDLSPMVELLKHVGREEARNSICRVS